MIVQFPDTVSDHVRRSTAGTQVAIDARGTQIEAEQMLWGLQFTVRYFVSAVHCGTQVSAVIACPRHRRLNLMAAAALRVVARRVDSALRAIRDDLE